MLHTSEANAMLDHVLERLLLKTCLPPTGAEESGALPDVDQKSRDLLSVLPELGEAVRGRRVADFGCGLGAHSVSMEKAGAAEVVGLDINERFLAVARDLAAAHGSTRTTFVTPHQLQTADFDVVLSYNSMEHFSDPAGILDTMRALVRRDGRVFIAFSPPWLSAYGAHFAYITPIPWVHLMFPEQVLMKVRARYKSDGARRFEDVEGGMNRMTVAKFIQLAKGAGFRFEWMRLTPMKGLPLVTKVPGVREFFTTRVTCLLRPE